jgi:hypothetical protein
MSRSAAGVHHEEHRKLTLLEVPFDVGRSQTSGDVPVNGPDVVPRLVLADLGELHPPAPERAGVLACNDVAHEVAGGDLEPPDLSHDLVGAHGTGTLSKIRCNSASDPTPSASAR